MAANDSSNRTSNPDITDVLNENNPDKRNKLYNTYISNVTPTHNAYTNFFHAFLVGGIICTIGQLFKDLFLYLNCSDENSSLYTTLCLMTISAILTGFGIYSKLTKYSGAGTVVPITGFANSVVSTAIEYKKEGLVFGIGCKIFTIAGPVILYGVLSSWILGLLYWIWSLF